MHIYWFYLISRMVYRLIAKGELNKDIRSESDDDVDERKKRH